MKGLQTLSGVAVLGVVCFLLIAGRAHADWFYVAMAAFGGNLVSQTATKQTIAGAARVLREWRKP